MAKTTLFKGAVYLSDEQYYKLVKDGALEVNGETILYDESMIYITPKGLGSGYYSKAEIDEKLKNIFGNVTYLDSSYGEQEVLYDTDDGITILQTTRITQNNSNNDISSEITIPLVGSDEIVFDATEDGKHIQAHLDMDITNKLARTLVTPLSKPATTELIAVDNTNSQVMLEVGDGLKVENGKLNGDKIYDLIIRTQEDFDAFINSMSTISVGSIKSILLVGKDEAYILNGALPLTEIGVLRLDGINNPVISANEVNANGVIVCPEVNNIHFNCTNCYSIFYRCNKLYNCSVNIFQNISTDDIIYGFLNCKNLINCAAAAIITSGGGTIFYSNCQYILNCTGNSFGNDVYVTFENCSHISNCGMIEFLGTATPVKFSGANTFVDSETVGQI